MNDNDVALFKQAEMLNYSGQTFAAYELFRQIQARNPEQIEVLFWIVETTPNLVESRQVLDTIKRLQPYHPLLPRMEALHARKLERGYTPSPALHCPYCNMRAPVLIKSRVAIGGWVWFAAFFLLFLACGLALVPIAQVPNMTRTAFFFLFLSAIGFFIRKRFYKCSQCGAKIVDA